MKFKVLRRIMYEHGDTQETIAEITSIGTTTCSKRFSGQYPWTLDEMYAILDHYHIAHSELSNVFPKGGITA